MVVDGDGEDALGVFLADDVVAEALVDGLRRQHFGGFGLRLRVGLLLFDGAGSSRITSRQASTHSLQM